MRKTARSLLCSLLLLVQPLAALTDPDTPSREPGPKSETFYDEVSVQLFTLPARVLDRGGAPILGLDPGDLVARVGKTELPIVGLDWYAADALRELGIEADRSEEPVPGGDPPGRSVVLFVQNDFVASRISGHLKLLPMLQELVSSLGPRDRVAVFSYFLELKFWQDFTSDLGAVTQVLEEIVKPGATPVQTLPSERYSLFESFDFERARRAAEPETGLRVVADALEALPGEKDVIFVGYGLGEWVGSRISIRDRDELMRSLFDARATVFVLDVTQADYHTLGTSIMAVAAETGGTYASSFLFPELAMTRLRSQLSGHYMIAIDRGASPEAQGRLKLSLREINGEIFFRPVRLRKLRGVSGKAR